MTVADVQTVERWLTARRSHDVSPGRLAQGATLGRWRVQAYLGAGLSAEVYRVTHVRTGQEGALKLLVDETRGLKERFAAEADALRVLSLRVLPRFLGAGEYEGRPFYVMEYLQPLPDPLPRGEVPGFMVRVAQAVQALHDAGYIHRDLKPGNILRRANGEPVLIDLGLIKRRGLGVTDPIVRHGRGVSLIDGKPVGVGTLDYAAPEQLLKGEVSVQSDVFALGKILRSLYEGRPPHSVQPVIRRATRELPSDRFASAADFAVALRHRNRAWVIGAILFFALLCLLGAGLFPLLRRSPGTAAVGTAPQTSPPRVRATEPRPNESEAAYLARMLPRARAGEVAAQVAVAEAYFYGRGTATNRTAAARWYRTAAEAGAADAQASLGLCAFRGYGCEKNNAEAVRWWTKAARQGHLGAMNDLAFCYMHGFGVVKDAAEGFRWAMRAAERGHAPSQTLVGECYLEGRGIEADVERGETWLYRAARQGNARAQMLLRAW